MIRNLRDTPTPKPVFRPALEESLGESHRPLGCEHGQTLQGNLYVETRSKEQ